MENETKKINYPILILILIQILFIILVIVSIKGLFTEERIDPDDITRQPSVNIESLSSKIPALNADSISSIEHELLNIVGKNITDIDFIESKAIIRDESIHSHFFETENLGEVNFIVDIPDLEQSYQLFYEYSPDENNSYLESNDRIIALCVEPSEVKYQDFNCNDLYSQGTRNFIIEKYLNFADFDNFYAEVTGKNHDQITINLNWREETDGEEYIREAKEMVSSLGSSPDLFKYSIVQPEIPVPHSH